MVRRIFAATLSVVGILIILGLLMLNNTVATNRQTLIAITASPACTPQDVEFSDGNYRSGDNFPAGVYDIIVVKGNGNVRVNGVECNEYKNITLNKGTMMTINGVTIKLHLLK